MNTEPMEEPDVTLHLEVLDELDRVVNGLKVKILSADRDQLLKLQEGINCMESPTEQTDLTKRLSVYEGLMSPYIDENIKKVLVASIHAGLIVGDQMTMLFPCMFMGNYR